MGIISLVSIIKNTYFHNFIITNIIIKKYSTKQNNKKYFFLF